MGFIETAETQKDRLFSTMADPANAFDVSNFGIALYPVGPPRRKRGAENVR